MDKSVLLVLFCLQVFLLITAFTSTDAAALVRDAQGPQSRIPVKGVSVSDRGKSGQKSKRQYRGCWWRPGACSHFAKIPAPKKPQLLALGQKIKKKEIQQVLQQN